VCENGEWGYVTHSRPTTRTLMGPREHDHEFWIT